MTNEEACVEGSRGFSFVAVKLLRFIIFCLLLCGHLDPAGLFAADEPFMAVPRVTGKIAHRPIAEASALVKSRSHRDVFWTIADSGNLPHLYAIERTGKLIAEYRVAGAMNFDWESLAIDDQGHLFIGDVGNNVFPGGLPRRWVYRVREPNPREPRPKSAKKDKLPEVRIEETYYYYFPKKPFDVEAMFWREGRLYLIEKARKPPTRLYRLPLEDPKKPVELVEVGQIPELKAATGADISSDGRRLAICGYGRATIFALKPNGPLDVFAKKAAKRFSFKASGIEGCCWDGKDLTLVSEDRTVYSLDLSEPAGHPGKKRRRTHDDSPNDSSQAVLMAPKPTTRCRNPPAHNASGDDKSSAWVSVSNPK